MKLATLNLRDRTLAVRVDGGATSAGPCLVTPDEVGGVRPALAVRSDVDGTTMQKDNR